MSDENLLEPIRYYSSLLPLVKQDAERYYSELVKLSNINVDENRKTCTEAEKVKSQLEKINDKKAAFGAFLVIFIIGLLASIGGIFYKNSQQSTNDNIFIILIALVPIFISGIVFALIKRKKASKNAKEKESELDKLLSRAQEQMQPLNNLFDYSQFLEIVENNLPALKLNKFTNASFSQIISKNSPSSGVFDLIRGNDYSIDSSLSGTIDGKMFAFLGYKKFYWGTKTYTGTLPITYTEWETDSDGHGHLVEHTQILVAHIQKPYPMYKYDHCGVYYTEALPNLSFIRHSVGLYQMSEKQVDSFIKKRTKKFAKKEKNAIKRGENWTAMADNEFEALFNAENRDNDVEFRMMFTPYCIKNYNELFKSKVGLGDSFTLIKDNKINLCDLDASLNFTARPQSYEVKSHSCDMSRSLFVQRVCLFFREFYFTLAPFFMIPVYSHSYGNKSQEWDEKVNKYDIFDAESISAAFPEDTFKPNGATTEVIRKIINRKVVDFGNMMTVQGCAYYPEGRIEFVPVFGRDGYMHDVPVHWDEYLPLFVEKDMFVSYLGIKEREFYEKLSALDTKGLNVRYKDGFLAIAFRKKADDAIFENIKSIVQSFEIKKCEDEDKFSLRKIIRAIKKLDRLT